MEGQEIINLPASSKSVSGSESGELRDLDDGPRQVDSQPNNAETKDGETKAEIQDLNDGDIRNLQSHLIVEAEADNPFVDNSSDMQISDEITETVRVEEKLDDFSSGAHSESFTVEENMDGASVPTKKRSPIQNHVIDELVNRSVRNFRRSCQSDKLNMVLHPIGLEIKDNASRCFNCGSYSHSLKQCPKPHDNVAVNTAHNATGPNVIRILLLAVQFAIIRTLMVESMTI